MKKISKNERNELYRGIANRCFFLQEYPLVAVIIGLDSEFKSQILFCSNGQKFF